MIFLYYRFSFTYYRLYSLLVYGYRLRSIWLGFVRLLLFDADLGWRPSTDVDQQPHGVIIIIMYHNNNNNIDIKELVRQWTKEIGQIEKRILKNDISPNSYIKNFRLARACQTLTDALETYWYMMVRKGSEDKNRLSEGESPWWTAASVSEFVSFWCLAHFRRKCSTDSRTWQTIHIPSGCKPILNRYWFRKQLCSRSLEIIVAFFLGWITGGLGASSGNKAWYICPVL